MKFLLMIGLALATSLLPGQGLAETRQVEGIVAEVQLVDASALTDDRFLILTLVEGGSFLLPGATRVAAASGVMVAVDYLAPEAPEALPPACRVRVLGLPIEVDGEKVLHEASRPFEVYRNEDDQCA